MEPNAILTAGCDGRVSVCVMGRIVQHDVAARVAILHPVRGGCRVRVGAETWCLRQTPDDVEEVVRKAYRLRTPSTGIVEQFDHHVHPLV